MAGTIPLSMTQQLDIFGKPLALGRLYIIQAGTTSTPQNGFQDSALTLPWPNPIVLDAAGRLPQFFLADGSIKIRLTDSLGNNQVVADGLIVTGASSGGGGGSPVDATTVFQTGDLKPRYGTGVHTGWVRCNARTIGSATSGATERANADTQLLFEYLWNTDVNLVVSSGRGASSIADWTANKNIAIPDWRGRALAALDDMGNSAAGRLTAPYFGTAATVLGAAGGAESHVIAAAQLPANIPNTLAAAFTPNGGATTYLLSSQASPVATNVISGSFSTIPTGSYGGVTLGGSVAISGAINPSGGTPLITATPTMLATVYQKL